MSRFVVSIDENNKVSFVDTEKHQQLMVVTTENPQKAIAFKDGLAYQCNIMNELNNENIELRKINKKLEELLRGE